MTDDEITAKLERLAYLEKTIKEFQDAAIQTKPVIQTGAGCRVRISAAPVAAADAYESARAKFDASPEAGSTPTTAPIAADAPEPNAGIFACRDCNKPITAGSAIRNRHADCDRAHVTTVAELRDRLMRADPLMHTIIGTFKRVFETIDGNHEPTLYPSFVVLGRLLEMDLLRSGEITKPSESIHRASANTPLPLTLDRSRYADLSTDCANCGDWMSLSDRGKGSGLCTPCLALYEKNPNSKPGSMGALRTRG